MHKTLNCDLHGVQPTTFVCQHIAESLRTGRPVGFYWSQASIESRPDAWCSECNARVAKSGGEWVSSVDLENQISLHPAVFDSAVIGVPDPRGEERPLAIVVARPGCEISAAALRYFLQSRVARFWLPERWAFVEALPKTSVGKIDKKELRRRFGEGALHVECLK